MIWEQKEGGEGEEMAAKQYPPTKTRPEPFTKKTYDFLQNNYFLHYYVLNQKKMYNLFTNCFLFTKQGKIQPRQISKQAKYLFANN